MSSDELINALPENGATRQDVAESTSEIKERVDERVDIVRADLAAQTDTILATVAHATEEAKSLADDKIENVRVELAEHTNEFRTNVADATEIARREIEEKTEAVRLQIEQQRDLRREKVDQKFRDYRRVFVIATIIMLLANTALYYLYFNPRAGTALVVISNVTIVSPPQLCPGDSLVFGFEIEVKEPGVYAINESTWRTTPVSTSIIFGKSETFIVGNERIVPFSRSWRVPPSYVDPSSGESVTWLPGQYSRNIGFTAVGRNTQAAQVSVPFEIISSCSKG